MKPIIFLSGLLGELTLIELISKNLNFDIVTNRKNSLRKRDTGDITSYSNHLNISTIDTDNKDTILSVENLSQYDFILTIDWPKSYFKDLDNNLCIPIYHTHPSLLPKYRGYSAITEQIQKGVAISGLTIYKQSSEIDAGDIIYQQNIPIEHDDIPATFMKKVSDEIVNFLYNINTIAEFIPRTQEYKLASYTSRIRDQDHLVDFSQSAIYIHNFIRSFGYPYKNSFFYHKDCKYYIVAAHLDKWYGKYGEVGEIISTNDECIEISLGSGTIIITDIDSDNGKVSSFTSLFIIGDRL